ncbi:phospholipase [Spirosoma taeanense]|uniref:Phospholipase n=1 Tax=Spirosoma taeanense TaxID=2735870 RepID=A0A6M5Y3M8_9BACT|nr:lipase family protein [Spirosoma taeanense]QJW88409.1 phospholipase [Spirosoma taeanense]
MKLYSTLNSVITASLVLGLTLLSGCEQTEPAEGPVDTGAARSATQTSTLVSATPVGSYKTTQSGRYNVQAFRLVYATSNVDGSPIQASGLLLVPQKNTPSPMLSMQHFTIESELMAPSYYSPGTESYTTGNQFASEGYIVSAADYIGYGASRNVPHPYEHRSSLASASLDMLRAARQYLTQKSISWDGRLFIEGYSEGGFATLSLQKKLEQEVPGEFNLIASSLGAGAHDKPEFMKYIINNKTSGNAGYNKKYLWTLLTYDRIYGLNRPMSFYFKEPYASQITQKGKDASISVSLHVTFTDNFRQGVNNGTDVAFLNAVNDNDIHDWKPSARTRFYHGDADQLVFYFNSKNASDAMNRRQAPGVDLSTLRGKGHDNAISDFISGTDLLFAQLAR